MKETIRYLRWIISLLIILAALVLGLLLGVILYQSTGYLAQKKAESATTSIAANGYSGTASSGSGSSNGSSGSTSSTDANSAGGAGFATSGLLPVIQDDPEIAETAETASRSVITLLVEVQSYYQYGEALGSGVLYKEDDTYYYAITNAHVLENGVLFYLYTKEGDLVEIEPVGADDTSDLAIVRIPKKDLSETYAETLALAEIGDSDALRAGDVVIAIGSPQDIAYQNSVTVGVVSHPCRTITFTSATATYIQTDAAINPGNSGGGLFTKDGKLIGINSNKYVLESLEGMGFAIPINRALTVLEGLMS